MAIAGAASVVRSSAASAATLLSVLLLSGCVFVPIHSKGTASRSGDVTPPPGGSAVAVLFSRDFSPETTEALGRRMQHCVTRRLAEAAPDIRVLTEAEFYDAVFGVKPGEVLLRPATMRALFARPVTRQRAAEASVSHLIMVAGGSEPERVVERPALAAERTRLTASIFDLATGEAVAGVNSSARSEAGYVGFCCVIVVWMSVGAESSSCDALGAEVARTIQGRSSDDKR